MSERGLDLHGRSGLVLGATGGLGQAIVAELLAHGARLFVHGATNKSALADLCAHPEVEGQLADFEEPGVIELLFDEVERWCKGELGFMVYCAGVNPSATSVAETDLHHWDRSFAVNTRGAFLALKCGLPLLRGADPGKVVLVSSIFGIEGPANRGAYAASKHALTGLLQSTSKEEGTSVHLNAVCPGPAWGENVMRIFVDHARRRGVSVEEYSKERVRGIPAGRFVEPMEFARVVALYCSRVTDYVSGEVIRVTGGAAQ